MRNVVDPSQKIPVRLITQYRREAFGPLPTERRGEFGYSVAADLGDRIAALEREVKMLRGN